MEILRSHTRILGLVLCALLAAVVVACYLPPTQADLDTRESEADPSDEGEADVPDRVHLSLPSPIDDGSGALLPNFDLELSLSLPPYASDDAEVYVSIHYAGEEPSFGDDPVDHTEPLVYVPTEIPCSNEIEVHAYYVDDGEESEMTTRSFTVEYDTLSVSLDGDDENVGSNTEPLLTPAQAFELVREADAGAISKIRIRADEYVFDQDPDAPLGDILDLIDVNDGQHQTAMLINNLSDLEIAGSYGERFYEIETDNDGTIFDGAGEVDHVLYIDNSHQIALRNVTVTGGGRGGTGTAGGGIHLRNSTEVQIGDGVTVRDNEAESGGGVYIEGGEGVIVDGVVRRNDAFGDGTDSGEGGGIHITGDGSHTVFATIDDNTARDGGGVYVFGGSGHLIDAGITNNSATAWGGGVSIEGGQQHVVRGTINLNYADNGAGVYVFGGLNHVIDADVSGNNPEDEADVAGGGISIEEGENHEVYGIISGNYASNGGGVLLFRGLRHVIDAEIFDNTAQLYGGGVTIELGHDHEVRGTISGNHADDGGGINVYGDVAESEWMRISAAVEDNNAISWGGGISVEEADRIWIDGSVQNNKVGDAETDGHGGGIAFRDVTDYRLLPGLVVDGNTSNRRGGGIYLTNSTWDDLSEDVSITNNTADDPDSGGGGIYNALGTDEGPYEIPVEIRDAWWPADSDSGNVPNDYVEED